jgi:hypothetical protein
MASTFDSLNAVAQRCTTCRASFAELALSLRQAHRAKAQASDTLKSRLEWLFIGFPTVESSRNGLNEWSARYRQSPEARQARF